MIDLNDKLNFKIVPVVSLDTNNWMYDVLIYSNIPNDIKYKHYDKSHNYICFVSFNNKNHNGHISWNLSPKFNIEHDKLKWKKSFKKIINFQNEYNKKLIKLAKIKFMINYPFLIKD